MSIMFYFPIFKSFLMGGKFFIEISTQNSQLLYVV